MRNTYQARNATAGARLLGSRNSTIIVRFLDEQDCHNEAKSCLGSVYPECNRPGLGRDNKGREQWPEVWGENDECSPDVDFSCTLVEEEHIVDEHQSSALCNGAEKAVKNPSSHEGLERRCPCAPCGCCEGQHQVPEHHRQATKICRERDHEYATCPQHEHVANLGMVNIVGGETPDRGLREQSDRSRGRAIVREKSRC